MDNLQTKISEMQIKIEKLEQELAAKTWNVESKIFSLFIKKNLNIDHSIRLYFPKIGLQGELTAAHKDDEYVRKKLKLLEDEKTNLRHRYSENEDELKKKYGM